MAKLIKFLSIVLLITVLLLISMPTNGYKGARMRYNKEKNGFVFDSVDIQDDSEISRRPIITLESDE